MSNKNQSEQAEEIQEAPELAQDTVEQGIQDNPEWNPEISPELLSMGTNESGNTESGEEQPKLPQSQVKQAEQMALEVGGFLAFSLQEVTGRDYGLNEQGLKQWGGAVAPCLVKYGYTDVSKFMTQWGVEIQAAVATGAMAFGIYKAHRQYQREDKEKIAEANKGVDDGNQSE